jgi:hypothetical protein
VLAAFFLRAPALLSSGGRLAVVIVNSLAEQAVAWIAAAGLSVLSTARGTGHTVYIMENAGGASHPSLGEAATAASAVEPGLGPSAELNLSIFDLSAYVRTEAKFKMGSLSYKALGFWGLPDFDTVGYGPSVAAEVAERSCPGSLIREALVIEPGVGHFALWLARKLGPQRIDAASRDLLALAATGANLARLPGSLRSAYRPLDSLRLDELPGFSEDLLVETPDIVPEYDWISPGWERAGRLVKSGGIYLAVCPPTELGRLAKRKPTGWRLLAEKRRKGFAAAAWQRA